jgi:L-ribulose-5-phosphate 3-epimerase UlaE
MDCLIATKFFKMHALVFIQYAYSTIGITAEMLYGDGQINYEIFRELYANTSSSDLMIKMWSEMEFWP